MLQTTIIEMKNKMEEKLVAYKIARQALLNRLTTSQIAEIDDKLNTIERSVENKLEANYWLVFKPYFNIHIIKVV